LVALVVRLSDAPPERIDDFFSYGMWLNAAAAMGVQDLSVGCEWMREEAVAAQARKAEALEAEAREPEALEAGAREAQAPGA
jgi:hypothetical protein